MVLLWNCVYLVIAPAVAFWSIYAREEVGMTPAQVGNVVMWAYIAGTFGHLLAGQLVDRIGRKMTCAAFYSIAAVAIIGLFHTNTVFGQYFWHIATVFFFNCAIGATHVYASELFPTELRATGYGWTTNLFGRVTEVAIPYLIGATDSADGHFVGHHVGGHRSDHRRDPRDEVRAGNARPHARADSGATWRAARRTEFRRAAA